MLRKEIYELPEVTFVLPKFLLSAFPVVNVSQQHVPAGDTTFRVSRGESARLEPAVHAIGTPLAELKIMRLPGFDRVPPRVDHARKVMRMDSVAGGPILQFLGRLAEIFQDLAVDKFDLACRTQGTHKPRNGVDDQTKARLTLLARRLVALALNRNRREMRNLLDDFLILLSWAARLAPIDRKGTQYKDIRGQYGGRPTRFQTVRQRGR